jgi:hypothetical protein
LTFCVRLPLISFPPKQMATAGQQVSTSIPELVLLVQTAVLYIHMHSTQSHRPMYMNFRTPAEGGHGIGCATGAYRGDK